MSRTRFNAVAEVETKSDAKIERETAFKWAARAEACFTKAAKAWTPKQKTDWITRGQRFMDEALEHAAQVENEGKLVGQIERRLKAARRLARTALTA